MAQLNHEQYDALERAVANGTRIVVRRSGGRESIVIPLSIKVRDGRETVEARNPTTGHALTIFLDDVDSLEAIR
jgi:hypothetical protein